VLVSANQLEAAGKEIIHLEIGQTGIKAIQGGKTRYTPPSGMPSLKEAIADQTGGVIPPADLEHIASKSVNQKDG